MSNFDVTVVGELNLDLILYGLPEEPDPERELLVDRLALTPGSSSAIFAHNLAVMGSRVGFISRIGDDPLGSISPERLAQGGVDVSKVRRVSGPTTTGLTVILPRGRYRNILTYPGTMFEMCLRIWTSSISLPQSTFTYLHSFCIAPCARVLRSSSAG